MARPPVVERRVEATRSSGPWTPEEDILLASYVQEHGPGNWRLVSKNAGLNRSERSCRLRWQGFLRPGIRLGNFTAEEDRIIIQQQALLGNRWVAIAEHLPGRTDNDIRNHWRTHLKKKLPKVTTSGVERSGYSKNTPPQINYERENVSARIEIPHLADPSAHFLHANPIPFNEVTAEYPALAPFPQENPALAPVPFPHEYPALAPVPFPEVVPAPAPAQITPTIPEVPIAPALAPGPSTAHGREGHDIFTPFPYDYDQMSFSPYFWGQ